MRETWGSLGTWWFLLVFLSQVFPSSPSLFNHVSVTSFHDIGMVALAHQAPCASGARMQGEWEGYSEQIPAGVIGSQWKPPRRPDDRVWSRQERWRIAHTHPSLSHLHTSTHARTQEMVGLSQLTVVYKACTLRPISSSMGYVWQITPLGGK